MYRCCCQHGKRVRIVTGRDRAPLQAGFLGTRGLSGIKVRQNRNDIVGRELCARDSLLQTAWGSVVDPQVGPTAGQLSMLRVHGHCTNTAAQTPALISLMCADTV